MKLKPIVFAAALVMLDSCSDKTGISKSLFGSTNGDDSVNTVVFTGNISSDSIAEMPAVLKLSNNNTFQAEASDVNSGAIYRCAGYYKVEKNTIILKPADGNYFPLLYKVHENRLVILNEKQPGTEGGYLEKLSNALFERYWKLDELNGKTIKSRNDASREPHIFFRYVDNTAAGNSGCNGFSCRFGLLKGNTIKFSPVLSTKMACMDIDYENDFFNMLEKVNRYEIINDTLLLKYNTEIVLRFSRSLEKTTSQ